MAGQNGGARPGAGRPRGTPNLPRFSDYVTDEERQKFADFVVESYMGDAVLTKWFGDNAFAPQPKNVDVTTKGESLNSSVSTLTNEELEIILKNRSAR